jgi:hypothetical protein
MDAELKQHLLHLQISGCCMLPHVIPASECEAIRDSVALTVHREKYPGAPTNVGFIPSVINHNQSFAEYLTHARLITLLETMLGPHVRISFTSAIINEPGNRRGEWHADWPFNQKNAGHIPVPYPDVIMHITTLWMLSPFRADNGGTLVVPGSHRAPTNPTAVGGPDPMQPLLTEMNVTGPAGSVLVMDSRLWHATAPNQSAEPRVALAVRYAPWWLNLEVLRPESDERKRMCGESGKSENQVPSIQHDAFLRLPASVQQLYRHWLVD